MTPTVTDFLVTGYGSVWTIQAVSQYAKEFAEAELTPEPWMGSPCHFSTDWRPAMNLCEMLESEGFMVGGSWNSEAVAA